MPGTAVVAGTIIVLLLGLLLDRGPERLNPNDRGILRCPADAHQDLFSFRALQCWFDAPHGRWRMLSRVSAHGALIVEAEATELQDADEIARRFVAGRDGGFSEVLVYVQLESAADPTLIRRVRWTRRTGFEALQFTASPAR
ncbi:MAG: hypothetical protein GEU82_12950 [Luteitalea sp.]|nr:hypothetical protein [Luteitalea sp.]